MANIIELDDLNTNDDSVINITSGDPLSKASVNFGPGIELLMNEKKSTNTSPKSDIKIDDIELLENELNDLSNLDTNTQVEKIEVSTPKNNLDDVNDLMLGSSKKVALNENTVDKKSVEQPIQPETKSLGFGEKIKSALGVSTMNSSGVAPATVNKVNNGGSAEKSDRTWDGFTKMNNTPIDPDRKVEPELSKEETLRQKFQYLRKLEALEKKGAVLTKKYDMESSLLEMQGEYETIINEKEKSNSVKFQGRMLMAAITGLEFLNNKLDPFDLKLDGWSEQVQENLGDYDEIFAELHEKYKSKATMAPELKLLFQLGGGAVMLHMTNTMFKSAMPGMDDIMKQNPELMQQFTQAAAQSMSNNMGGGRNGFSDFMGDMLNQDVNVANGPPSPIETKNINMDRTRGGNSTRPDLNYAVNNDGIDINNNNQRVDDNVKFRMNVSQPKSKRNEMKGPSGDINEILAGLKTKNVDISHDNSSTISINEFNDMKGKNNGKVKRRNKSDKNTISLDI